MYTIIKSSTLNLNDKNIYIYHTHTRVQELLYSPTLVTEQSQSKLWRFLSVTVAVPTITQRASRCCHDHYHYGRITL